MVDVLLVALAFDEAVAILAVLRPADAVSLAAALALVTRFGGDWHWSFIMIAVIRLSNLRGDLISHRCDGAGVVEMSWSLTELFVGSLLFITNYSCVYVNRRRDMVAVSTELCT